ncbi:GDP-mannose transporter [Chloropicon primus]|uniref:GDP-mannose transporter n=2 Tax=Chloropicon primus TaxID=1764295 RepID=A0A5B8MEI3_9CHLO|nr:GDP-mannose transporter [Chloropicon primus]UPQ97879.1 GDP-mannose transporter [Chloropicon primus]|eukprot:QDZ18671.1 GDP-mannose transporter [Chloropicon primus]
MVKSGAYPAEAEGADARLLRSTSTHIDVKGGEAESKGFGGLNARLLLIIVFQLGTSVSMSLVNKAAIGRLPFPIWLVVLQTVGTVVILEASKGLGLIHYDSFDWNKGGKKFVGVSVCFVTPMVFSMIAMKHVSVPTLVVFRQITTALTLAGEYAFFQRTFGGLVYASVFLGILGSLVYSTSASDYSFVGYFWSFVYAVSMAVNCLYIKKVFDQLPKMSNFEKTYYQNLEAIPFLLLLALPTESASDCLSYMATISAFGWLVILFSCFAGFAISVAGILARDALSPTAFNVLGNCSKPMTVVMSFFIFGAESSAQALVGLGAVLGAGLLYSYSTQKKK